ncbi:RCC1 domain-containing protein [Bifidobacterium xylocopae]
MGSDGNTYAWGDNREGQLGNGTTAGSGLPKLVHTPAGVHFTQVSAGGGHSLAIGDDGHAYSWGWGAWGQLGHSTGIDYRTPGRVDDPAGHPNTHWTTISAGFMHSLAIDSNGHAYGWGDNYYGEVGDGTTTNRPFNRSTPVQVIDPAGHPSTNWTAISAGNSHSLAINSNGQAYSWGDNSSGQLGNGNRDRSPHPTPARVLDPTGHPNTTWTTISAGVQHSLGLTPDGHAYSWGDNGSGQLGDNTTNSRNTPGPVNDPTGHPNTTWTTISAGVQHSLGLTPDGHAYSWGDNGNGQLGNGDNTNQSTPVQVRRGALPAGNHYTAISTNSHSLAIDNKGHAYSWGANDRGQLGDNTNINWNTPVQVTAPWCTITSVNVDGTTIGAGDRSVNPTTGAWDITLPSHAPGKVDVTVTYRYQVLDNNGNLISDSGLAGTVTLHYTYTITYTVHFSLGDATGHTTSPTPGDLHPLNGDTISFPYQVPTWGRHWFNGWSDSTGRLWDFNRPVIANMTLTAKWEPYLFTLTPTSGPVSGGNPVAITSPEPPQGIRYIQISAGSAHSLAIGSDGNTYAWGWNRYGQLGDGTTTGSNTPVRVRTPAGVHFTQVSAGELHSLAIGSDGHAYSWGGNGEGELGDNSTDQRLTPVRVNDPAAGTTWTAVSAGTYHSLGLTADGHAYSWGYNGYGQLGDNTNAATRLTPVRVNDPAAGTTWTAVSAGAYHSLGLTADGHAYSWGYNSNGELGDNTTNSRNTPGPVNDPAGHPNTTWTTISAGGQHSLGLTTDGHAYSWGTNSNGQLGDNTTNSRNTPGPVNDPAGHPNTTWTTISAGGQHSLGLTTDGHAYSWGTNSNGQLGDNTTNSRNTPGPVNDPAGHPNTTWTTISAGGQHSLGLTTDGHAYSWGTNSAGQLGDNTTTDQHMPVPVGQQRIQVTGATFDTSDAAPAPTWNPGNHTWDTNTPPHGPGTTTAHIHWTLGGQPQDDYDLAYTYTMILPKAGSIPMQRLTGVGLLALSLLASLILAGRRLSHARHTTGRHTTTSA